MISIHSLRPAAPQPTTESPFGAEVRALDALLADGVLTTGQVSEWVGPRSCGKTAVLATYVRAALRRGLAVAWIDARRRLLAGEWADLGAGLLWVVRPPSPKDALFCAESMLRTRSFRLVVMDEGPRLQRAMVVRLQRLARQSGAALAVLTDTPAAHRVHRRLGVQARVIASDGPLARRIEPAWRVELAGMGEPRAVYVAGRRFARLAVHPISPDRPQSRTRPGERYGL